MADPDYTIIEDIVSPGEPGDAHHLVDYQTQELVSTLWSKYLAEAYQIARKNRRIGMFVGFLIKDERRLGGWQSGFFTASGARKPAYTTFRRLPH